MSLLRRDPGQSRADVDDEHDEHDIVGGGYSDPPETTELDDAIEIIAADYVPDVLLRLQFTKRVLAEVTRRTGLHAYACATDRRDVSD